MQVNLDPNELQALTSIFDGEEFTLEERSISALTFCSVLVRRLGLGDGSFVTPEPELPIGGPVH